MVTHVGSKIIGTPTLGLRGLVLWLKFNEGSGSVAYDSSFHNNHGTIYGATWTDGKLGKALSFDGAGDYVRVKGVPSSNSMTVAVWIKYRRLPYPNPGIFCLGPPAAGGTEKYFGIWVSNDGYLWGRVIEADGGKVDLPKNKYLAPDTWYFIVQVADSGAKEIRQYVNGELISTTSYDGTIYSYEGANVGRQGEDYWDGVIDEVRIYNRALSEEEIRMLYYNRVGAVSSRPIYFVIPSLDTVTKSYGRRYVKINNNYGLYGDDIPINISYAHYHTITSAGTGGGVSTQPLGYYRTYDASYTPKYLVLGNELIAFTEKISLPNGAVMLTERPISLPYFTAITGKYIYVNADSDGGRASHTHMFPTKGGEYGIGAGVGKGEETDSVSNEIPDRVELYGYEYVGTYDPSKDPIPIGKMIFIRSGRTIPSNYELVDLGTKKGLLRFAENTDEILACGGTETHNHSIPEIAALYDTTKFAQPGYTYDNTHMPPYIAVKLIKRKS